MQKRSSAYWRAADNTMRHEHCEMPGCGKRGKQEQAFHSSTSPWKSRQQQARFPHSTAPATKAMEKWKTKSRFSTFHAPRIYWKTNEKPRRAGFAPPVKDDRTSTKGDLFRNLDVAIFRLTRIGIELPFQAHGVLESILDFRLICGLEYATAGAVRSR